MMNEIRAFVGHSFVDDDAMAVGTFLKYFDQLSRLYPTFSWVHAEPAEPKLLAEKVLSLLTDRNVFIGICTKKERIVANSSLTRSVFHRRFLKAREEAFGWTTSDWVVQEIGLAVGRGLQLILLVEDGLRKPGGLQGDIEYIPFDRTAPEKSFGKLLEMITALSPKGSSSAVAPSETKSIPPSHEREPEPPADDTWITPTPEWNRADYSFAVFNMLMRDDSAGFSRIKEAYLRTEDARKGDNAQSWEARCEFMRLSLKGGGLAKLKELVAAYPRSSGTLRYLAQGFEHYQEYAKAASAYEAASREATEEAEKLRLIGLAGVAQARAGMSTSVAETISRMKAQIEATGSGELTLLDVLRRVAEIQKEDEAAVAIMERIVEVDPGDTDTRFSLAYKYSDLGHDDLALLNYLKIPDHERKSTTWNNLGVAFDRLTLPAKSIGAFRRAEEMGESLAMSNLAYKLMSAGFLAEAKKECEAALLIPDFHKNVGGALERLKEISEEEDTKEAELLTKTKPKSDFYKEFGRAVSQIEPMQLSEAWDGPDCVLTVALAGTEFKAVGSYEQKSPGILAMAIVGVANRPLRFRVEYSGTLRGRAIEGHVARAPDDARPAASTILGSPENKSKVLMVLSDDGSELKVMEKLYGGHHRFYALKHRPTEA